MESVPSSFVDLVPPPVQREEGKQRSEAMMDHAVERGERGEEERGTGSKNKVRGS